MESQMKAWRVMAGSPDQWSHATLSGMFNPYQEEVWRFFCSVQAKARAGAPMDALETLTSQWVAEHPEYAAHLADADAAMACSYDVSNGQANPFLHLAMHLSISEQCSIDQPSGIRQAVELLAARRNSLHDAHHEAMECLGEMIWQSQRSGLPPDGHQYLDCVRRKATQSAR